jgi:hypothetical protein
MYVSGSIISTQQLTERDRVGAKIDSRYRGLQPVLAPLHNGVIWIGTVMVESGRAGGREKRVAGIPYIITVDWSDIFLPCICSRLI